MISTVLLNLGIALAYFLLGKFGLLMALPPGYATAIWPPAGVAFAACLIWGGGRAWPGVFLGALAVNVTVGGGYNFSWVPWVVAASSALQAVVGSRWLKIHDPGLELDRPQNVTRFGLMAIFACIIASLISNVALNLAGLVSGRQFLQSFLTWWMGDALGVMIFTPVVILLFDRRESWKGRRLQVGIPLLVAFSLCGLVYRYVYSNEELQLQNRFQAESVHVLKDLREFDSTHVRTLISLAALFESSQHVDQQEFAEFTQRAKFASLGFSGLGWASEKLLSSPGKSANVLYLEPASANKAMFGFDLYRSPEYSQALYHSRQSGLPALSANLGGNLDNARSADFLVAMPVRAKDGSIVGFGFGLFDLKHWLAPLYAEQGLQWTLTDLGEVLHSNAAKAFPEFSGTTYVDQQGVYFREIVKIADRQWVITLHKPFKVLVTEGVSSSLLVLFMALAACGILGHIALIVSGDRKRINSEVANKTQALSEEIERRKQSEALTRENERRYRTLFDEAPVGHAINRLPDGKFLAVNPAFSEITGYSAEETADLSYRDLTPRSYAGEDARHLKILGATGRYGPYEKHFVHKDGRHVPVRLNGALILAPNGEKQILSVIEDVSGKEQAEDRVKLLANVFEHRCEAIVIADAQSHILEVNPAFVAQTGYAAEEVLGQNLRDFATEPMKPEESLTMWSAVSLNGFWQGEVLGQHKDGHADPKWMSISVVRDKQGEVTHHIASFADIGQQNS